MKVLFVIINISISVIYSCLAFHSSGKVRFPMPLLSAADDSSSLDHELDIFFEKAASQGIENIMKLTPHQRAELASKGAFLEDEIFLVRSKLLDAEEAMINGHTEMDRELLHSMRNELNGLKLDYVALVGAGDTPLYFGRDGVPDSLQ